MAGQDLFLRVESARQGAIKGESRDDVHKDEIDVVAWSWGMQASTALGSAGTAPKSTVNELYITKPVDSASTALMAAMRNNDEIKKAVLTCRKEGKGPHDYLRITLQKARITSLKVATTGQGSLANEELAFAFQRILVEYIPQGDDGRPRGGMQFETEIAAT